MKQLKPVKSPLPPAPTPVPQGPRYRYFSNPPLTVTVRLGDLAAQIPAALRLAAFDESRAVELPCDEILRGPVPKIPLSRLSALVPDCVDAPRADDHAVRIPADRLAARYKFIQTQELIEEPVLPPVFVEDFSMPELSEPIPVTDLEAPLAVPETPEPFQPPSEPSFKAESELAPPDSVPAAEPVPEYPAVPDAPIPAGQSLSDPPPVPPPVIPPPPVAAPPIAGTPVAKLPQSRRVFSILPIFRRKEKESEVPPIASLPKPPEPRPRVEIPKPKFPQTPLTAGSILPSPLVPPPPPAVVRESESTAAFEEVEAFAPPEPPPFVEEAVIPPESPASEHVEVQAPEPAFEESTLEAQPPEAPSEPAAVWVETEHLPHSDLRVPEEIPDQDGLQAVFMTEEFLSLDRVLSLCGGLPGIKSCVLAHGSAVLAAHSVPDTIDLISLSANALEMLRGMRESSAKMGVGAIPAVTLHSDKGPITFFHQDDLCLLVLHKDRGFVPGVREKLQQVVQELGKANLPLLVSPAKSSLNG